MKKLILSIIFAGCSLINLQAACCEQDNNWYMQANGSYGWHNDSKFGINKKTIYSEKQKPGFGGSFAIGHIMESWRLELEASHRESSSKSKFYRSNTSLMANVYYDFEVMEDISFYIGAGAGISSVNGKVKTVEINKKSIQLTENKGNLDTVFAWQAMAGFSYALNENWDLITGYRLFATAKPTIAKIGDTKVKMTKMPLSNNVEIGLRFKF